MGKWKPWHPRPVLIPADSFMEKDHAPQYHWIHDRWPRLVKLPHQGEAAIND
ncbi:hypothetical protein [Nitrosomonas sp. Nm33]|uniref:hypothetical protein n=1 Tax=Nitrosomonas sp. Nm33 TaxID=133724 RepID=UPI0015A2E7D8|nr:hypothetical protein [Nitrosomonas sp. Nm33]